MSPGCPREPGTSLGHIFDNFLMKKMQSTKTQGGGGEAAAPLCPFGTLVFIKKKFERFPKDAPGIPRDMFSTFFGGLWGNLGEGGVVGLP